MNLKKENNLLSLETVAAIVLVFCGLVFFGNAWSIYLNFINLSGSSDRGVVKLFKSNTVEKKRSDDEGDYLSDVNKIYARINFPWSRLLTGLENTGAIDIELLSIRPDIQSGQISVEGEASSEAALERYLSRLVGVKYFNDVYIKRNVIVVRDRLETVEFEVSLKIVKWE